MSLSEIPTKNSHGQGHGLDTLRVFTDGDIMARTKNRQEEKSLKSRLLLLDCQQHRAEELLAKERKLLMEGRRKSRQTTGRSPVVETVGPDSPSDSRILLKHLRKPWAFSFTETSYNAVYNDAFDPYMCRVRSQRTLVARSGRTCVSAPPGRVVGEADQGSGTKHRPVTAVGCLRRQRTDVPAQNVKSSDSRKDDVKEDHVTETCIQNGNRSVSTWQNNGKGCFKDKLRRNMTSVVSIRPTDVVKGDPQLERATSVSVVATNTETVFVAEKWANETICCDSGVIVQSSNIKTYKNNSSKTNHHKENGTSACASDSTESDDKAQCFHDRKSLNDSKQLKSDGSTESTEGHNATAEELGDFSEHTNGVEYVVFKGRTLHNYVKPQDRYKRDPFKETRQEKLLHKLAIENPWYLNGNRPMSVDVRPQFSKRARDWALKKMTLDNMTIIAETRRPVVRNPELDRRVKEFCYPFF